MKQHFVAEDFLTSLMHFQYFIYVVFGDLHVFYQLGEIHLLYIQKIQIFQIIIDWLTFSLVTILSTEQSHNDCDKVLRYSLKARELMVIQFCGGSMLFNSEIDLTFPSRLVTVFSLGRTLSDPESSSDCFFAKRPPCEIARILSC